MSYFGNIVKGLKVYLFDKLVTKEISDDPKGVLYGFINLFLIGLLFSVIIYFGTVLLNPVIALLMMGIVIMYPIFFVLSYIIGYSIYHFCAKFILRGKGTGAQYFKVLTATSPGILVLAFVQFIPFIGQYLVYVAGAWVFLLNMFILGQVHEFPLWKTIISGILPILLLLVLALIFAGSTILMMLKSFGGLS